MSEALEAEALLREIVRRLVARLDPDKIILFGSRARGDSRAESDLDLLVIRDSEDPPHRRSARAYRAIGAIGVPKDILWYTPQEVEDWSGAVNHVISRALREGRVLYERPS